MGVINFEIDVATGRARVSRRATFYAALVNITIFSMMPLMVRINVWSHFWKEMNGFHEYVFLVAMCLRIVCVFVTMLNRWWERQQIISLMGHFRRLVLKQPQVRKLWRRGVISKFISGVLTELMHVILALYGLRDSLNLGLTLSVVALYTLLALLNIILSQYYFALLTIHGHYVLFNEELRSILAETQSIELDHRIGVRNLRSCALADRMDSLAHLQAELQTLIHRMTRIFGIQSLCMGIIIYITLVGGIFYTFLIIRHDSISIDLFRSDHLLLLVSIFCYLVDTHITFSITYDLEDQHAAMRHLIVQNTSLSYDLDMRLQATFESFQLQLVRNPLKLTVMGLYNIHRGFIVAMFSSIVTNSLILIQYDIKNY
ncbi:putative gustatory receptor 59d [Drosophila innubila]|uniref:putative gustatory receptor 59d n=1 Tax=Drosophila innubila TaxID=198719 RepID=UPI00148C6BA8|nr:putative gustatory receptor 59d [Drosophila innubila]